ncbi:helix-hairpin-helix domain-containing protein [Hominenteromicrobium sp.]|uniref:helix-hairpin-helix domain-containing protein n=1 Tax=Hominenteromicrobium sp. TaxID=3073581 RepID=UPI003A9399BE
MTNYAAALAAQFHLKEQQTAKLIELIDAGNTIPFIARYRKEEHGSLDDQTIRTVYERLQYLRNLDTRKAEVRELIEGTGNLTPEIEKSLTNAATLAEIDDIYRPFRPKRKTRAGMAKERGLEPLAKKILAQEKGVDPMRLAEGYVNVEKGVNTSEDALNGAKDIIAETISDDAVMRRRLRMAAMAQGVITSRAAKDEDSVYRMYYEFSQPAAKIAGHRVLALDRGEREGLLKVSLEMDDVRGQAILTSAYVKGNSACSEVVREAKQTLVRLIKKYGVTLIAIGNGTASKETEIFTDETLRENHLDIDYMVVSEAGASVYSASKLAAAEYPEYDLTLRSAVSIAHRLQDPLAELVKIDPKAIGVGQYQHDMPAKRLDEALGGVVEACVNAVGVDLNTASPSLLENIAGVSSAVAKNIVAYRQENGAFTTRAQIKKVPKLGPKAFEQCAGFLRVPESKNILDHTGVHPESYDAAGTLLTACGYDLKKAPEGGFKGLKEKAEKLGIAKLAVQCGVGEPTLKDIIAELEKPGRDPRDELPSPILRSDIKDMKDLKPGMEMRGTVRNVIDFGAFVDIGVHQDGLVHITQISDKFVRHPSDVLKVGDIVTVWVLAVDVARGRISLTMKKPKEQQN